MIQEAFFSSARNFSDNRQLTAKLWSEIAIKYSEKKRYYHNLDHLESVLVELIALKNAISDWDTIIMAVVYHDIIYTATASDNEEKSADFCESHLRQFSFPEDQIFLCQQMILATKGHTVSKDPDTNIFTDLDLSMLGKSWNVYQLYFTNIRKEYSIYPDFLYNPGRKKVLKHFLGMPAIFKTEHFQNLYEQQARENLQLELNALNN